MAMQTSCFAKELKEKKKKEMNNIFFIFYLTTTPKSDNLKVP